MFTAKETIFTIKESIFTAKEPYKRDYIYATYPTPHTHSLSLPSVCGVCVCVDRVCSSVMHYIHCKRNYIHYKRDYILCKRAL